MPMLHLYAMPEEGKWLELQFPDLCSLFSLWLLHFSILISQTQNMNFSWLAEPDDGPGDNYWIVNKLLEKFPDKMTKGEELEGPHYEDQWWIGAKSAVSSYKIIAYKNSKYLNKSITIEYMYHLVYDYRVNTMITTQENGVGKS